MHCQRCHENVATVQVTDVEKFVEPHSDENLLHVQHVCDDCALHMDLPSGKTSQVTMADNIWKLLQYSAKKARKHHRSPRCKDCGMSLEELRRHGRLGCAQDYEVFKEYLHELLERMHGSHEHVGRVPGIGEGELERIQRVTDLKGELDLAIRKENYEHAASIRDELKLLDAEPESA